MATTIRPAGKLLLVVPAVASALNVREQHRRWVGERRRRKMRRQPALEAPERSTPHDEARGIFQRVGVRTKHFKLLEIHTELRSHGFHPIRTERVEYSWDTEFERPTRFLDRDRDVRRPFDWLIVAERINAQPAVAAPPAPTRVQSHVAHPRGEAARSNAARPSLETVVDVAEGPRTERCANLEAPKASARGSSHLSMILRLSTRESHECRRQPPHLYSQQHLAASRSSVEGRRPTTSSGQTATTRLSPQNPAATPAGMHQLRRPLLHREPPACQSRSKALSLWQAPMSVTKVLPTRPQSASVLPKCAA